MAKTKKGKKDYKRYIMGVLLGSAAGFIISHFSHVFGSQCLLLCQTEVAMAYFGLIGFIVSLK